MSSRRRLVADYEADLSLPTFTSHLPAKRAELGEVVLVLDVGVRRVAMDDHRLVPDEGTTSLVVAPDTLGLRISGRTAEHPPEHLKCGYFAEAFSVAAE